jgi:hypothetical protein
MMVANSFILIARAELARSSPKTAQARLLSVIIAISSMHPYHTDTIPSVHQSVVKHRSYMQMR